MCELQEMEEKHRVEEKQKKDRISRLVYRRYIESLIANDLIDSQTSWREFFKKAKETEQLYNVIGMEPSSPKDIFNDYIDHLLETQHRVKRSFKRFYEKNITEFPLNINSDQFSSTIQGSGFLESELSTRGCNSKDFYTNYLFKKLDTRNKKIKTEIILLIFKLISKANTDPESFVEMAKQKGSYQLRIVPDKELIKIYNEYQMHNKSEEDLLFFIETQNPELKHALRKIKYYNNESNRSIENNESLNMRKRDSISFSRDKNRDVSLDRKSDETELGEIKQERKVRNYEYRR